MLPGDKVIISISHTQYVHVEASRFYEASSTPSQSTEVPVHDWDFTGNRAERKKQGAAAI